MDINFHEWMDGLMCLCTNVCLRAFGCVLWGMCVCMWWCYLI